MPLSYCHACHTQTFISNKYVSSMILQSAVKLYICIPDN